MDDDKLFSTIKFVTLQCNNVEDIRDILIQGGAKHINYLSDDVTLVIADRNCTEAEEAADIYDKPVVNSLWVYLSVKAKKLLPTEAFSPINTIFSDVVASFSPKLSINDVDILAATLTFYGARVSKDITCSTHFIEVESHSIYQHHWSSLKVVGPDWILESVRLKRCCDEKSFDSTLLLSPPPPPTLPKINDDLIQRAADKEAPTTSRTDSNEQKCKIDLPQEPQMQMQFQSQSQSSQQQQNTIISHCELPRPRPPQNNYRCIQPRFRPILPPNNNALVMQRPPIQQPKKVTLSYGQYPKTIAYQNNMDNQQTHQMHQTPYAQPHHVAQPPVGAIMQPSRLPQPTMYTQVRGPYQNNHMPLRGIPQQPMMNQQQHPSQMINRFPDGNIHMNQRPYQVCLQSQQVNQNYPSSNIPRQTAYYNQGSNQLQMRVPQQQGPPMRRIPTNEQVLYDNYASNQHHPQHIQEPLPTHTQPYQPDTQQHQFSQVHSHNNQQQIQQYQPVQQSGQPRPSIQPNLGVSSTSAQTLRTSRPQYSVQEQKTMGLRFSEPAQNSHNKSARMAVNLPKPQPSMIDSNHDSNRALIKAKVPIVLETIDYLGHDPKENIPVDMPLTGCRLKFVDYALTESKVKEKWYEAIQMAGGSICNDLTQATHLICEDRLSADYTLANELGVRCVTIYWINDVLAQDLMSYPWKALHIPVPFTKNSRPLKDQTISVTNLNGKLRREVQEMIMNIGATYTETFSSSNTLLICGNVGGEKFEHALEWKTPIANCQLLSDLILSGVTEFNSMLKLSKYQLFNRNDPLKLTSYSIVQDVMKPWLVAINITVNCRTELNGRDPKGSDRSAQPCAGDSKIGRPSDESLEQKSLDSTSVIVTNGDLSVNNPKIENHNPLSDNVQSSTEQAMPKFQGEGENTNANHITIKEHSPITQNDKSSQEIENQAGDIDQPLVKTIKLEKLEPQSARQNDQVIESKSSRASIDPVRILFTHLDPALTDKLKTYASRLNLNLASAPTSCTHLIVDRISRTPNFICAFSHARYILNLKWIIESNEANCVLDEKHYILEDKNGEEIYSFNLVYSMFKRGKRNRPLFDNMIFFVTPSVMSRVPNLKEMIESAGGILATKKPPSKLQIYQIRLEGKRLMGVTCKEDMHLCSSLKSNGIDLVDAEFIITGILRQDIDIDAHRLSTSITLGLNQNCAKRQRIDTLN